MLKIVAVFDAIQTLGTHSLAHFFVVANSSRCSQLFGTLLTRICRAGKGQS